jgi:putative acetyltransferase
MVTVRGATQQDLRAIADIKSRALRHTGSAYYDDDELAVIAPEDPGPEQYQSLLDRSSFTLVVAEQSQRTCGFGALHVEDAQIHAIFVDPDATDQGLGTALLKHLERRAVRSEAEQIHLLSTLNATGFYDEHGYAAEGETAIGEGPGIPVVRMEKRL